MYKTKILTTYIIAKHQEVDQWDITSTMFRITKRSKKGRIKLEA